MEVWLIYGVPAVSSSGRCDPKDVTCALHVAPRSARHGIPNGIRRIPKELHASFLHEALHLGDGPGCLQKGPYRPYIVDGMQSINVQCIPVLCNEVE